MNRREFLKSAAAALVLAAPRSTAGFDEARKRVALIGSGWYGKTDLFRLIQVAPVDVVALCDVDRRMLADAASQVASRQASRKRPRTYTNYRTLLEEQELDLVIIVTPDHWHALARPSTP